MIFIFIPMKPGVWQYFHCFYCLSFRWMQFFETNIFSEKRKLYWYCFSNFEPIFLSYDWKSCSFPFDTKPCSFNVRLMKFFFKFFGSFFFLFYLALKSFCHFFQFPTSAIIMAFKKTRTFHFSTTFRWTFCSSFERTDPLSKMATNYLFLSILLRNFS